MAELDLLELPLGRRHHPAGDLVVEEARVEFARLAERQALGARQTNEVVVHARQRVVVDLDGMAEFAQIRDRLQRLGQRRAAAQRADADVQDVDAEIGGDAIGVGRHADRAVRMQFQRQPALRRLDGGNQRAGAVGGQEARWVLDVEPIEVRRFGERGRQVGVEGIVVRVAQRIGERADDLGAAFLAGHARGGEHRLEVVHRVEHDETGDAVARQAAIDEPHDLRVQRLPGDEAEADADELQRRIGRRLAHQADALPGVLAIVLDRDAHVRRGDEVDGAKADPVHDRRDLRGIAAC